MSRRGGNWTNSSNAGAFALNLNNARTNSDNNNGFRAARSCVARCRRLTGLRPVRLEEQGGLLHANARLRERRKIEHHREDWRALTRLSRPAHGESG